MAAKLYSTSDAAKKLRISRIAVFKKVRQGRLPAVMIGGSYAITPTALETERRKMERRENLRRIRRRENRRV